jgi:hypothetical protein
MGKRGSLYAGQLKKWRLRGTYCPMKHPLLSGVALVSLLGDNMHYTYIAFSREMVRDMGMLMPFGLRPDMQAHLFAEEYYDGHWGVYGVYVQKPGIRRLLYETQAKPSWIKWSKEVQHGEEKIQGG